MVEKDSVHHFETYFLEAGRRLECSSYASGAIERLTATATLLESASTKRRGFERAVDIGAAPGLLTAFIREQLAVPNVTVVSLRPSEAFERYVATVGVTSLVLDVERDRLPFPDRSCDCLLFYEVIEHLIYPQAVFAEMARIVAPEGTIVIGCPNLGALRNRLGLLRGKPILELPSVKDPAGPLLKDRPHVRPHLLDELRALVDVHGLAVTAQRYAERSRRRPGVLPALRRWARRCSMGLVPTLKDTLIIVVRPRDTP